jgi:hypothetical protein
MGLPLAYIKSLRSQRRSSCSISEGKVTTDITRRYWDTELLTEAEWEFASRGGKHDSEYKMVWKRQPFTGCLVRLQLQREDPIGGHLEPNALGIYDMSVTYSSGAQTSTLNIPLLKKQIVRFQRNSPDLSRRLLGLSRRKSVYLIGLLALPTDFASLEGSESVESLSSDTSELALEDDRVRRNNMDDV